MAYPAQKPTPNPSSEELKKRIPGWGVDLDPVDRPAVPRERFDPAASGAHWELPEQQPGSQGRERSMEHKGVTPVFGTAQPLKGASGAIRRFAYDRFSEGRAAHWLLLVAADRVDAAEEHARSLVSARPDNPVTETGVLSEARRHGWSSRFGSRRVDVRHAWMDPLLVAGPWVLGAAAAIVTVRSLARR